MHERVNNSIVDRLAGHAMRTPEAPALIGLDGTDGGGDEAVVSYRALDAQVRDVAAMLREAGCEPGTRVGLRLSRGLDRVVGALGTMAAGGVFVPIDAEEPEPRLAAIVALADVSMFLTDESPRAATATPGMTVRGVEDLEGRANVEAPSAYTNATDVAGVFVRPASNGTLAAVPITHRALWPLEWGGTLDLTPDDRVAHPFDFAQDAPALDALHAIAAGACAIEMPSRIGLGVRKLGMRLRDRGATIVAAPAAFIETLTRQFPWALRAVRVILCDDRWDVAERLSRALDAAVRDRVLARYATPELGGAWLAQRLTSGEGPSVQVPADAAWALVDDRRRPVSHGIPGEICIASDRLSPAVERTATGLYATGEMARCALDGRLERLGRQDRRLLVQGLRVEPVEIERVLKSSPTLRDARVDARTHAADAATTLVATVTPSNGTPPAPADLLRLLRSQLPDLMVPDTIVVTTATPHNELEAALTGIWCDVLARPAVGLTDNFFDLGGHSMALVRVASLIKERLGRKMTLMTLFAHPTIQSLAAHLSTLPERPRV